jgi:hypothetical protein
MLLHEEGITQPPPSINIHQFSQNFVTVNNTKFPDTATRIVISVVILKVLLFTLMCSTFSQLKISGNFINKRATEINFHLKGKKRGEDTVCKIFCPSGSLDPCTVMPPTADSP